MDKKNKISVLFILAIIFTIIGTTFSWLNYRSTDTALVLKIGNVSGMVVTVKPYIINSSLTLTDNYQNDGKLIDVTVTNNHPRSQQIFNLYFDIDSIDSVLNTSPTSNYFKYIVLKSTTGNANSYTETVATGDFTGANTSDNFIIYSESVDTNTTYYYKVYIYLERDMNADQSALQNKTFKAEFRASIENGEYADPSGANAPELTSGMVPVKLNENGTVVTTVDPVNSGDWYDYSQQKWANAVLVDSSVRGNYIDSTTGDIIPSVNVDTSKILAYYVWIPRFKYTFADNTTQRPYPVQSINIVFEDKNAPRVTGGANGVNDYYTHPAFTWNFNGDTIDESTPNLGGIWVGKFELSHTTLSSSTTSNSLNCSNTSCTNANNIRILPNTISLRYNSVSNFFYGVRSMQQSDNSFGLPTDTTTADSHVIKTREWGAVAYLAHSVYGLGNQEVRMNSYSTDAYYKSYMTGCGASITNPSSSQTTCYDPYGKTTTTSPSTTGDISTYPQSTTGNITGVFDISGGVLERVMGNYNGTTTIYDNFSSLPALKYYDKYTATSCTFAQCGGHALHETEDWHSDESFFIYSSITWLEYGGSSSSGSKAGSFSFNANGGGASIDRGARAVVVVS